MWPPGWPMLSVEPPSTTIPRLRFSLTVGKVSDINTKNRRWSSPYKCPGAASGTDNSYRWVFVGRSFCVLGDDERWPTIPGESGSKREEAPGTGLYPNLLTFYGGDSEAEKRCDGNIYLNCSVPCRLRRRRRGRGERESPRRSRAVYGSVL